MGDMERALKAAEDADDEAVWIGLQRGGGVKWHWSLADKHFYKEGERNYFVLNRRYQVVTCVRYTKGVLHVRYCAEKRSSLCFDGESHSSTHCNTTNHNNSDLFTLFYF